MDMLIHLHLHSLTHPSFIFLSSKCHYFSVLSHWLLLLFHWIYFFLEPLSGRSYAPESTSHAGVESAGGNTWVFPHTQTKGEKNSIFQCMKAESKTAETTYILNTDSDVLTCFQSDNFLNIRSDPNAFVYQNHQTLIVLDSSHGGSLE